MVYLEEARAKINLTLNVMGRLDNGYHTLHSLVAFAGVCDQIQFIPGPKVEIKERGPFAKDLQGQNLLEKVFDILKKYYPQLHLGQVILEKNLPVASGMGGGSADAAALLRAIQKANTEFKEKINWAEIAAELGADVPVCMENRSIWMSGIGTSLHQIKKKLPPLSLLLVNPLLPVPTDKTARVFKLLEARSIKKEEAEKQLTFPEFLNKTDLLNFIKEKKNDLYHPASKLLPVVSEILDVLRNSEGLEVTSLSGAGPTCFGIFSNNEMTELAQRKIRKSHPSWWVKSATLY